MVRLTVLLAVVAIAASPIGYATHQTQLYAISAFGLIAAMGVYGMRGRSRYMQILIILFAIEAVGLDGCVYLNASGLWPSALSGLRVEPAVAMSAALFAMLAFAVDRTPAFGKMLKIADRYFATDAAGALPFGLPTPIWIRERHVATGILMLIIVLSQTPILFTVQMTMASRDLTNAMQAYDKVSFWHVMLVEYPLALVPLAGSRIALNFVSAALGIRWRAFLTHDYSSRWLDRQAHFRITLAGIDADNPDQRIHEDIPRFIDGSGFGGFGVLSFTTSVIRDCSTLLSFSIILWNLSQSLSIGGIEFHIPGLLFWFAVAYAAAATGGTAYIGRRLATFSFAKQHYEGDLRHGLSRVREFSEQIALSRGEAVEIALVDDRFAKIVRNYFSILYLKLRLNLFSDVLDYSQTLLPYLVVSTFFFSRQMTMGDVSQASLSFMYVNQSLSFFIGYFQQIADFVSVIERLHTFEAAIDRVDDHSASVEARARSLGFRLAGLAIRLPCGKPLSAPLDLDLDVGVHTLIMGQSGTGKSTLFRVFAGIWPYYDGSIDAPPAADVLVISQKPYLPDGTLATVVSYPSESGTYSKESMRDALLAVDLGPIADELDIDANWAQRLSGGEQQRLAIARAVLHEPKWLLLDEATAAMDAKLEQSIYAMLLSRLHSTTIVSIAHREALAAHHHRRILVRSIQSDQFELVDLPASSDTVGFPSSQVHKRAK